MSSINVKIDGVKEAKRVLADFPKQAPGIVSGAINRAITNMGSNINKEVRSNYEIKAGDVRATLKKKNSTRASLSGSIQSTGGPIPLDRFKISPKTVQPKRKKQLKITIKKGRTKQITGAFVANINGIKIFKRETKKRLKIKRLYGVSVPQMIGREETVKSIEIDGRVMFERRLTHGVQRVLERYGG